MSDLQVPYNINDDAKQRVAWLDKRIQLASGEKEYVEFQIKEAVARALREANVVPSSDSGLHLQRVSGSTCFHRNRVTTHRGEHCVDCGKRF